MGYLHVANLYKDQRIMLHKECFALEKIHGTSAHLAWKNGEVTIFSGGEKYERFAALFDVPKLTGLFMGLGHDEVIVYGEAYGGSQQKQAWRYGPELRFVAFDVKVNGEWLNVPDAEKLVRDLGLEFVFYRRIAVKLSAIDAERDAPSTQAARNGIIEPCRREGVVLRPIVECVDHRGERVITKHKRDEEREMTTPRQVVDPVKMAVLQKAQDIADEWVTPVRLEHVLDKMPGASIEQTRDVVSAMQEDVLREAAGEIVDSREARAAIGRATAVLFKRWLQAQIKEAS